MKQKYSCIEKLLFFPPIILSEKKIKNKLQDKTILITGASYGIGASTAYLLAKTGAKLILVARTENKLLAIKKIIEKKGGKIDIFVANLNNANEVEKLIISLKSISVDIFINNAGKSIRRSIKKSLDRFHDFDRTMKLNYYAPVKLLLALIPSISKNKGHIVDISAVNVLLAPVPNWAAYQASKSAFDNWFRSASPELNAMDIKTTSVYLPLVRTRMILPVEAYHKMPAMKTTHAALIVTKTLLKNKSKYAPWWLIFGQLGSVFFRKSIEKITTVITKKYNLKNEKQE